jgi:hypothetical protein
MNDILLNYIIERYNENVLQNKGREMNDADSIIDSFCVDIFEYLKENGYNIKYNNDITVNINRRFK